MSATAGRFRSSVAALALLAVLGSGCGGNGAATVRLPLGAEVTLVKMLTMVPRSWANPTFRFKDVTNGGFGYDPLASPAIRAYFHMGNIRLICWMVIDTHVSPNRAWFMEFLIERSHGSWHILAADGEWSPLPYASDVTRTWLVMHFPRST